LLNPFIACFFIIKKACKLKEYVGLKFKETKKVTYNVTYAEIKEAFNKGQG